MAKFDKVRHVKYWKRCALLLPEQYTAGDGSRLSLAFFIVAALDLLDVMETAVPTEERKQWIDWVYSLEVPSGGLRGFPGTNLGSRRKTGNEHWDPANLHNTFLGLMVLLMLGDDLGRLKRLACLEWVRSLMKSNGGFGEMLGENEEVIGKDDLRSVYCAIGILYILTNENNAVAWLARDKVVLHIVNCQDLEGGLGQSYLREAHAGMNFCGMATLALLDRLFVAKHTDSSAALSGLLDERTNMGWMLLRQTTWIDDSDSDDESDAAATSGGTDGRQTTIPIGFAGRCNKMADTCYCFWNGGVLAMLKEEGLIETEGMRHYLNGSTQHMIGGFSKVPGATPDLLHAYLGLAALAVVGQEGLQTLDSALVASSRTAAKLEQIRKTWPR